MTSATDPARHSAETAAQPPSPSTQKLLAELLQATQQQNRLLERIAAAVEAGDSSATSPNYEVCLTQFRNFDWAAIDATVEQEDQDGVATVLWRGHR